MIAYSVNASAAHFTTGVASYNTTTTLVKIAKPDPGVVQKSYDALGYLWDLLKVGWVSPAEINAKPNLTAVIEYAYSESVKALKAHQSLEGLSTKEVTVMAAYLAMARQNLSENSFARLSRLVRSEDNWDGEGAKAMSLSALVNFTGFFERTHLKPSDLSIFLNYYGEILTTWSLKDGASIDMSFGEHQIELVTDEYECIFASGDEDLFKLIAEL
ncbi:hypothetical protein [Pseudomonas sp. PDM09]|uniref:hypothetical protein n=1 Tax=Pseudomonas sp. PDM09 TaxID=2769270 RepID=UPI0017843A8D|nr:hypothetical protein [Pseudomonas sp. PDM09]MBD9566533.1 hypothetical protein [Pseudomonas sp. PDM09]